MSKISKDYKLALSKMFWILLQRKFQKASMPDGLLEVDYLIKATSIKKETIVMQQNGILYWKNITDESYKKWLNIMTVWGVFNKNIKWTPEIETYLLKASLRFFTIHQDGPISKIMTDFTKKRSNYIIKQLITLKEKINFEQLNIKDGKWIEIFEQLNTQTEESKAKWNFNTNQFYNLLAEMNWKIKISDKIKKWLLRKGTIPLSLTEQWLESWQFNQL